jgi:osmotically inducible protein OsmC
MKRTASAHWEGSGKEGKGTLTTERKVLNDTPYSYLSRFEEGQGTNPEELLGAAHAGCFNMKLSFVIGAAGFTPASIDTIATVSMVDGTINEINLDVTASITGVDDAKFQEMAKDAKENCPVSKLFNATITMTAKLV